MIKRYEDAVLASLWSDKNKVAMWLKIELAVILARVKLGRVAKRVYRRIEKVLLSTPVNISQWLRLEKSLRHDLNAFVVERKKKLPPELRRFFHDETTSYDTEEPAFVLTLSVSCKHVLQEIWKLEDELLDLIKKYWCTPMNARTHGQEAEMQSFGARCLTWLVELRLGKARLVQSMMSLKYSKLSGAIGKYGTIDPLLEKVALEILGLKPFYGATQIVPRALYLPTAQALCQVCQAVDKISLDIRLMARSGKPLVQEPFGKFQTGSSAMPQKKNTISTEKNAGMARLARGNESVIEANLVTWEERAIEQSSAERVAWPDLFHVAVHAVQTLTKVLKGLKVYPDNMYWEILNSRGCYAAAQAKDWLKKHGSAVGIDENSAYRIVQLAAFNVHNPCAWALRLRENPAKHSLIQADSLLEEAATELAEPDEPNSLEGLVAHGTLQYSEQLAPTVKQIQFWNGALQKLFASEKKRKDWHKLFTPSYLLRNEQFLFREIISWTPESVK